MEAVYSMPFLGFHFSKHHHALAIKTAPLVMKTERKINTDKTLRRQDAFKHRIPRSITSTCSVAWLKTHSFSYQWRCTAFNKAGKPSAEIQHIIDRIFHAVSFQCFTFWTLTQGVYTHSLCLYYVLKAGSS